MREVKSTLQLKREYYSQPQPAFTPMMVEAIVREYPDRPATSGEAAFILRERLLDLVSALPLVGKFFHKKGVM